MACFFSGNGALIMHCPVVMEPGQRFKDDEWDPLAYSSMEGIFLKGTWNCEFADEVTPQDSDIILQNRVNFSAFKGTQLKSVIEEKGVKRLFVLGFLTNVCVTETIIEARELFPELTIYVCSDGCGSKSKQVWFMLSLF